MKVFIASDLHGSFYYVNRLIDRFLIEKGDLLILLGDILYHGPRNDLPKEYNPKKVIELLNNYKEKIVCVRGNCDAEVDQMVLDFDVTTPLKTIEVDGLKLIITHGHKINPNNPIENANAGDIVLFGHSHVVFDEIINGVRYINPGSVSIPKREQSNTYLVLENGIFNLKTL